MQSKVRELFTTIKTEGALLPPDLLQRVAVNDSALEGLSPVDYHLGANERLNEAISRSWNRLLGAWRAFQAGLDKLQPSDNAVRLTRERWLLLIFQELGFGRLMAAKAIEIDGNTYPISHLWQNTPMHMVGARLSLDTRTAGVAGAARTSPHSLVQELLNRSQGLLWGTVSNGLRLRLLRDNVSITRQSYVEFDLEAMFEGQVYADFALFWLLCHQSRFEGEKPSDCWLEKWSKVARNEGTRALDQLRSGVEQAISVLGQGFLAHRANRDLREKLQMGSLSIQDYYRQLLRLVYRLIFLFVAEERDLLLLPLAESQSSQLIEAQERYNKYYSSARLRKLAGRRRGTAHDDLFQGLLLVMRLLNNGCSELALPALGSFLWSGRALPDLSSCRLSNHDMLDAIFALSYTNQGNVLRVVDYKNLGAEELGSIYESLLEQHPKLNVEAATFELSTSSGNERKTTGSYYTPTELINSLLDSALNPVLNEAIKTDDPERAILNLKVCDPACGSGHFLIGAAHRMAKKLATIRTGDLEPAPSPVRTALRDVIGHCLYGVDMNEMAVELCKVSLWMESLEPGKPLSFLEHRIKCGNSLLGTTPALLRKGIPDAAFNPIEGDNKKICQEYKKRNKEERNKGGRLFDSAGSPVPQVGVVASCLTKLDQIPDDSLEGIQAKEERYLACLNSNSFQYHRLLADTWCAAFVWKKTKDLPYPITEAVLQQLEGNPEALPSWMEQEIRRLSEEYQFFHWHLAFPEVFGFLEVNTEIQNEQAGWSGGFDIVLGNPPWDRLKPEPAKFFSGIRPDISIARTSAIRQKLLKKLENEDPLLFSYWKIHERLVIGFSKFLTDSGLFILTATGKFNLGNNFLELSRRIISPNGRLGMLNVSGLATDDSGKEFISDLIETGTLYSFYDFENRLGLFPGVHRSYKFSAITIVGEKHKVPLADFVFFALEVSDLDVDDKHIILSLEDIKLLNPISRNCPIFRSKRQGELVKNIYNMAYLSINKGNKVLYKWNVEPSFMFVMSDHSHLFITKEEIGIDVFDTGNISFDNGENVYFPLYESKMFHQYNNRWSHITTDGEQVRLSEEELLKPSKVAVPRYWISDKNAKEKLNKFEYNWLIAIRGIARATDERTSLASIIPKYPVGHSAQVFRFSHKPIEACCFIANLNSYAFDFATRTKVGGANLSSFIIKQLPILPFDIYFMTSKWKYDTSLQAWIADRVLELSYCSFDLEVFANDCGYYGKPFRWDEDRRFKIRCEIDAAYFHIYGIKRDDVDYIMETFPIVKRKDEERFGIYWTKELILEIYDLMQKAMDSGIPYETILDPPPGDPRRAHQETNEDIRIDTQRIKPNVV